MARTIYSPPLPAFVLGSGELPVFLGLGIVFNVRWWPSGLLLFFTINFLVGYNGAGTRQQRSIWETSGYN